MGSKNYETVSVQWSHFLSHRAFKLLADLAQYVPDGEQPEVRMSRTKMAQMLGYTGADAARGGKGRQAVYRLLRSLVQAGALEVLCQGGTEEGKNHGRYRIVIDPDGPKKWDQLEWDRYAGWEPMWLREPEAEPTEQELVDVAEEIAASLAGEPAALVEPEADFEDEPLPGLSEAEVPADAPEDVLVEAIYQMNFIAAQRELRDSGLTDAEQSTLVASAPPGWSVPERTRWAVQQLRAMRGTRITTSTTRQGAAA